MQDPEISDKRAAAPQKNKIAENDIDPKIKALLENATTSNIQSVYQLFKCDESGLSQEQVVDQRKACGMNKVAHEKPPAWYIQLFRSFLTPFNAVLVFIALVSLIVDVFLASPADRDYKTVIVVLAMVLFSSLLRFWQEFRSNKAALELQNMVKTKAEVLRKDTGKTEVNMEELVPGDIVYLSAGDMVPADCRMIQSKDLFVNQSMLTGEALPVEKSDKTANDQSGKSPIEMENLCFMGTNVVSGTANAIVITTGDDTYFGSISKSITGKRAETSFDKGVNSVSWLLIRFMLVMVPLVFIINLITKGNWVDSLLFAIAVAVGLTPEMLPMIVTANLAKGAISMSRKKVIVKRLNAIQNFGAMDILCTDKTGTLTMDKIMLEKHLNVFGDTDDEVLKWAYLNSYYQTGLKNLLDVAVLEHKEVNEIIKAGEYFKKIDEIPFDFQRRRMSVILETKDNKHLLICKGAVEEMLNLCTRAFDPGEDHQLHIATDVIVPMDEKMKKVVLDTSRKLNEDGLRVLLIAIKEFESRPLNYSVADESDMVLTGFIGFLDPPKASAKPSIEALQKAGISVKVLTGDNEIVTRKICGEVGITVNNILLGSQIENLSDEQLEAQIEAINVFAKLNPVQKSRIVKMYQKKGHTLGFLGDGINDATALKDADVGISVDSAADVAKESADIILLEKDLMVLQNGVIYGRRTFGNIIKYIKMTASSNFGNMFSMLGASAFFPFLPMRPVQILVQNLLYDISQSSIPWDTMDEDYLLKPRKWEAGGIARFMLYIGPVSSIFDYITFALLFFYYKENTPAQQNIFQSGWFMEGLISQTLIVHMIRTKRIPFIQSRATMPVLVLTGLVMIIGFYLPFSPLASALYMQPLPASYFIWLAAILISYCLATQLIKIWFIKKFGYWL